MVVHGVIGVPGIGIITLVKQNCYVGHTHFQAKNA
jgi:hypothetical protein